MGDVAAEDAHAKSRSHHGRVARPRVLLRWMVSSSFDGLKVARKYANAVIGKSRRYEDESTGERVLVDTVDAYDVASDVWTVETRLPTPRWTHHKILSYFELNQLTAIVI